MFGRARVACSVSAALQGQAGMAFRVGVFLGRLHWIGCLLGRAIGRTLGDGSFRLASHTQVAHRSLALVALMPPRNRKQALSTRRR
jgi:hypothetical protein